MPPGRSIWPVMAKIANAAEDVGKASLHMSRETPHCSTAPSLSAIMRAARAIFSSGIHVISEVLARGYSSAAAANSSKP